MRFLLDGSLSEVVYRICHGIGEVFNLQDDQENTKENLSRLLFVNNVINCYKNGWFSIMFWEQSIWIYSEWTKLAYSVYVDGVCREYSVTQWAFLRTLFYINFFSKSLSILLSQLLFHVCYNLFYIDYWLLNSLTCKTEVRNSDS